MRVAQFRAKIEQLENLFHVHRHACVGKQEKAHWLQVAMRVLDETKAAECKRANGGDLIRQKSIIEKVSEYIAQNQ